MSIRDFYYYYPHTEYQIKIQKIDKHKLSDFYCHRFEKKKIKVLMDVGIGSMNHMFSFSKHMGIDIYLLGDYLVKEQNISSYKKILEKLEILLVQDKNKDVIIVAKESINNVISINSLLEKGFYYVCGESIFSLDLNQINDIDTFGFDRVRLAEYKDMDRIKELSQYAHRDIRYYNDPVFDKQKVSQFYGKIASDSINKKNELCYVYESEEGRVDGFITILLNETLSEIMDRGYSSLDYISVDPIKQKKGIGFVLNNYALKYLKDHRYEINVVKTMGNNYRAMGLLVKNQFILSSQNLVFHKYLKNINNSFTK